MTLQQKLFLAFLFIVIIPITLLGMIVIELIITRSDENIANIVMHELAMAQARYQGQGEMVERGISQAVSAPHTQRAILQADQKLLQHLLQDWQRIHARTDLWFIADRQGRILAQFSANSLDHFITAPFEPLLSDVLSTAQSLITTELLAVPDTDEQHLVQLILVPVESANNLMGVVLAVDRLDNNVWYLPPQAGLSYGGTPQDDTSLEPLIFITQQHDIISTSPTDLSREQILTPEIREVIQVTLNNNWGLKGRGKISTQTYELASAPIFDSNHQIVGGFFVGLPYRKYFGLQAQTGWIVMTMLILSGVISLITASLIASAITQPIQNLIEKSGLLARGDLSVRASVSGKDEIAQLGQAFNKMAANLETSYEAIEQERHRALAIIEASADGIWVVNKQADGERCVTIVNSALERMTGRRRNELVGRPCSGLMGVCTPEGKSICATTCPFTQPHQKIGIVHGLLSGDGGGETPVEISYGRLTNRRGELTGLVHIMRDLTLRWEVEQLKADFISMVSHELRTPLSHIKGFASTLLQTDVTWDAETQRDFLGSIDREVDRLTRLVENLLQMSRIEAGGLKNMERFPHHVDELLELILPELRQRANQHPLVVNVSPMAASNSVLVDARRIELVLANLVENAAKYSPPQTKIIFSVESNDERVIFHLQDEGPGIALQEQTHIFDRFYRVRATRRGVGGTGLGLAICKQLVEAHGGEIWVTSQSGQGACFSFSLPLDRTQEVAYA